HRRRARSVVVGAGRVAGGVEQVLRADARVVVAADDIDAVFGLGLATGERGDDVDQLRRLRDARRRRLGEFVELDLQPPARVFAIALELGLDPAPRRADAARVAGGLGKRVARAEADEFADRRFDV